MAPHRGLHSAADVAVSRKRHVARGRRPRAGPSHLIWMEPYTRYGCSEKRGVKTLAVSLRYCEILGKLVHLIRCADTTSLRSSAWQQQMNNGPK